MHKWEKYDRLRKKMFPVRWFLSETLPDAWNAFTTPFHHARNWVRYRVLDRYHVLKLDVEPGYMDPDEIMLQANFKILKDFVEIELAAMNFASDKLAGPSMLSRFKSLYRWGRRLDQRNPASGLAHLDWEITECKGTPQGDSAAEKKLLYLWWTQDRPARFDIYEDPHFDWQKGSVFVGRGLNSVNRMSGRLAARCEAFYEDQDDEMLVRLMKVRKSLWT